MEEVIKLDFSISKKKNTINQYKWNVLHKFGNNVANG